MQVFFFVTFLENRKKIVIRREKMKLENYPAVTIVVPCWNEEKTVYKTVCSLLDLNYPKEKIKIMLIDDGSTDGTLNVINQFVSYPNIKVFHKENGGGKYAALNWGLERLQT
ncbi:MAG TPA: glycosyltransferase, partial [Candidatus Paceibacterota bacterium]|nr:glycosyltransferase [Candidatus Paceibacterota bacterium]